VESALRGVVSCLGLIASAAAVVGSSGCDRRAGGEAYSTEVPKVEVEALQRFAPPCFTEASPGDTFESIARRLAGDDWVRWRDALVAELDPRRLRPGTEFFGRRTPSGVLGELRVVLDMRSELQFRLENGDVLSHREDRPVESEVVRVVGEITSSLFGAVEVAGGHPDLAVRLAEIFQWDIDFFRDLRQADRFVVIVDRQTVEGEFYRYGHVFAARFVNDGRQLDAIAYPDDDGHLGYYDLNGSPLRKQFLRSPLKFSRITSRFSHRRFHPVLKKPMPHYGVDYGAPVGTPVRVTANGTVSFAGRKGGAGRMVTVRHTNGYETNYLHLRGYAKGVRRGARVAQGQVIGYVGSSGLSTGPHLDYRVKLNGRWTNPLRISSPAAAPLAEHRRARYLAHALAVLSLIEGKEPPAGASC